MTRNTLNSDYLSKVIKYSPSHEELQVFEYISENATWLSTPATIGENGVVYVGGTMTFAIQF